MPWVKGQSGNPTGARRVVGLSKPVRASQGLETWAKLLAIRDGLVLERRQIGVSKDGTPIFQEVVADVKELVRVCQIILGYCWGLPAQKINLDADEHGKFAFAVIVNPQGEKMLEQNEQPKIESGVRPNGIGFDFSS